MNLQNVLPWYSSQELREQNQETIFLRTSSLIKTHVIIIEVREGEGEGGGVDTSSFRGRYQMVLTSDLFPTAIYSKRRPLSKAKDGSFVPLTFNQELCQSPRSFLWRGQQQNPSIAQSSLSCCLYSLEHSFVAGQ